MDNKAGDMKVEMVAEGTITYPDGTEHPITITAEKAVKQEKEEDGNNTNSGD